MTDNAWLCFRHNRRRLAFALLFLCCIGWGGCEKISSMVRRDPLPDMGPRMNNSVKLTFDPSFTELKARYADSCGRLQEVNIGSDIETVMIDAASQNFRAVSVTGGVPSPAPADTEISVMLQRSHFKIWQDTVYDRVPADLSIEALVSFKDAAGKELGQETITILRNQRLILEPTQHRCDYGNLGEFIYDSGVAMSVQFIRAARAQLTGGGAARPAVAAGAASSAAQSVPATASKSGRSAVSFKATVLDENGNLVFEGGERVRVRVDVVNTGDQESQEVKAVLTGTSSLLAQFPATSLSAGRLQPGQSRSLEFVATLPQSVQPQKAELQVSVNEQGAESPAPQILSLPVQPSGATADDVDQIPVAASGFKRPQTFLLSIGIGSYRDQQVPSRKYGASDAEAVATYFQSVGGLPTSNVRLLQDWKALRPDIEEALLDWLPARVNRDAVVIVYFAGLATVSSTGEVFLVPYEGTATSTTRAYPLKDLESALSRLKVKQTIVLFDGAISRLGSDSRPKAPSPQWNPAGSASLHIIAISGLGRIIEDDRHRHGLFTYYLLRALRGDADTNRDGEVSLAEAVAYVSQKVAWTSKSQYGQEQRPAVLPPLKPGEVAGLLVLSKLAVLNSAEASGATANRVPTEIKKGGERRSPPPP